MRRKLIVGKDDGWRKIRKKRVEKENFREKILINGRVIINVIEEKIGEGERRKNKKVEKKMVKKVRRGLNRRMGKEIDGKLGKKEVKLKRVGSSKGIIVDESRRKKEGSEDIGWGKKRIGKDMESEGGKGSIEDGEGKGKNELRMIEIKLRGGNGEKMERIIKMKKRKKRIRDGSVIERDDGERKEI